MPNCALIVYCNMYIDVTLTYVMTKCVSINNKFRRKLLLPVISYDHPIFMELWTDIQKQEEPQWLGQLSHAWRLICRTARLTMWCSEYAQIYIHIFMANLCKSVIKGNCIYVEHRNRSYICIVELHPWSITVLSCSVVRPHNNSDY